MTLFTKAQSDSTITEVKRQALQWFYERNECREILFISSQQNAAYQDLDSIQQMEIVRLRSAIATQGEIIAEQKEVITVNEKKIGRLKRQRWVFGLGGLVAGISLLFL